MNQDEINKLWVIMRSDLSGVLYIDGDPIVTNDLWIAERCAEQFGGVPVKYEEAKKIIESYEHASRTIH